MPLSSCVKFMKQQVLTHQNRKQRFGSVPLFFDGHVTHWSLDSPGELPIYITIRDDTLIYKVE